MREANHDRAIYRFIYCMRHSYAHSVRSVFVKWRCVCGVNRKVNVGGGVEGGRNLSTG